MGRPRGRGRRGVEGGVTGALRGHDGRDGQGVDSAARGLLVAVIAAGTAPPPPPPTSHAAAHPRPAVRAPLRQCSR